MTANGGPLPISATQGIAAQLEAAAKRGQLQKRGMASRARLTCLPRVERKRQGAMRQQTKDHHGDDRPRMKKKANNCEDLAKRVWLEPEVPQSLLDHDGTAASAASPVSLLAASRRGKPAD